MLSRTVALLVLSLLTLSLLIWPDSTARRRLVERPASRFFENLAFWLRRRPMGFGWIVPVFAAVGGMTAGVSGLCSSAALAALGLWYVRFRGESRKRLARAAAFATCLRSLTAELRVGAHPASAAAAVAADAPAEVAEVFRRLAAMARLGGDIGALAGESTGAGSARSVRSGGTARAEFGGAPGFRRADSGTDAGIDTGGFGPAERVLHPARRAEIGTSSRLEPSGGVDVATAVHGTPPAAGSAWSGVHGSTQDSRTGDQARVHRATLAEVPAGLRQPLDRVSRAWALADRHGIALSEVLDAVQRDIEHRVSFARDIDARMAGPRATAGVLAVLPVLGVGLGEATGSAPLSVLTDQPVGQLLLGAGVGLLCVGVLWTARLTRAGVRV